MAASSLQSFTGGCHCQAVRFEVRAPENFRTVACNCSICAMTGFIHLIVPADRFRLLAGEDALQTYQFNTKTARHYFCRHCGIKSFYVPRSHPDGFSVNVRCLDSMADRGADEVFDGRNWESSVAALTGRSGNGGD